MFEALCSLCKFYGRNEDAIGKSVWFKTQVQSHSFLFYTVPSSWNTCEPKGKVVMSINGHRNHEKLDKQKLADVNVHPYCNTGA